VAPALAALAAPEAVARPSMRRRPDPLALRPWRRLVPLSRAPSPDKPQRALASARRRPLGHSGVKAERLTAVVSQLCSMPPEPGFEAPHGLSEREGLGFERCT